MPSRLLFPRAAGPGGSGGGSGSGSGGEPGPGTDGPGTDPSGEKHVLVFVDGIPATCTTDGMAEYWKCTDCGKMFGDELGTKELSESDLKIPALTHDMIRHDETAPSCTTEGNVLYYECSRCGLLFSDEQGENEVKLEDVVLPVAHDMKYVDGVSSTCLDHGYLAHYECEACGQLFMDEEGTQAVTTEDITLPARGASRLSRSRGSVHLPGTGPHRARVLPCLREILRRHDLCRGAQRRGCAVAARRS